MKLVIAVIALFLTFTNNAEAKTFSLANGGVIFDVPDKFAPMSAKLIKIKYPRGGAPRFVLSTPSTQTSIAYDLKPNTIPQEKIGEARAAFTKLFPRLIPGLKWIKNDVIMLAGQKWILMEITSSAIDTDIHNIMLITGYKGKMLLFNFNSTKKEFPQYEAALRKSIQTIKIK